ncbi:MAG: dienelactone hydrolase family protein [Alphaproteobacteria bacterium]|nr:dienelactone hydrolase family protein [Alphaproteobacteria bacterium]
MLTRDVAYKSGNVDLKGYLAAPDGARARPGVLVCHQGMGITEHTRERARMLADEGYVALALDMYGTTATTREQAMALLQSMTGNPGELRARALAGLEVLKAQDGVDPARLAAVGYCFGGAVVLELARAAPALKCVVAFHPGMAGPVALPESDERPIPSCKVMVCAGADDPLVPDAAKVKFAELMNAARADWQLLVYGGAAHSFTDRSVDAMNMPGFRYDAATDRRSWAAMKELFGEVF